ncbi:ubiquitin-like proteins [Tenacibaculum phage PTm1]|uniref:Ubiquitin-like proteins n=1 Tax=Tenacibaculum phage PTm1 TaxID=2547425 RepID=A0A5S9HX53_9CAUD|nr:ubiquitin-like proteins [Tenacibaculum phage PTm1]BBI90420.1 ubiquitin-like proteins [Tenacibaculum phage PTm1]
MIGGGLAILGMGINTLANINISKEQAHNFRSAVNTITDTFIDFANPLKLPILLLGMAQAGLVAGSTLAMSGAVALVSKLNIAGEDKFNAFKHGAITLSDIFADFGSPWKLAKVTLGAGMATMVAGATLATSLSIGAMTKVISSPSDVTRATQSLDLFIGGVEGALVGREKSFPAINKGIHSFMGLSNMVREVADSAQAIGNLEFIEKEVRNGKVVVKSVRKFTQEDFGRIGTSVGMMLSALTEPLSAIGGTKDSFSIGGFTVTNPFSNKVQAGIQAVSEIGNVFTPLATILDVFSRNNIDEAYVQKFNKNLGFLLNGLTTNFIGLQSVDDDSLRKLGIGTKHLNDLLFNVSADKMNQGTANFERMASSVTVIKNAVNGMDLDKLSKLNELVFNVKMAVETNALEELVGTFAEFIEDLSNKLGSIATNTQQRESKNASSDINTPSDVKKTIKEVSEEVTESQQLDLSEVVDSIEELSNILRTATLKVRNVDNI